MLKKPLMILIFLALGASSALLVGCGGCYTKFAPGACSATGSTTGGGTGNTTGPFNIGGVVSGLASGSSGLVLLDDGADSLTATSNGSFTFPTTITSGQPYSVSIFVQPTNPAQTCTVSNGSGTATSNVTSVQVTCSTGSGDVISGQVTGLLGSGLVLQDNGTDSLSVGANGGFQFPTTISNGASYNVNIFSQPSNPAQTCTVANGKGTATSNVGTVVVTCSAGTLTLGGSVSGLAGTGMALINSGDGDSVAISANGSFQFPILLVSGTNFNVSIQTQPSGPSQVCTLSNGSGKATANVSNLQVVCPAVFHSIGGQVVGLYVPTGQNSNMVLMNNGGDNLPTIGDGPFTFVTQIAHGSSYDVSIFVQPNSQTQDCTIWGWSGVALANVTDVTVDCGHNDWTWMDGPDTSNQDEQVTKTPPAIDHTKQDNDTPGGSKYATSWTDANGNLWLLTGYSHALGAPNIGAFFGEMWEYIVTQNYDGGYANYWTLVPPAGPVPDPRWGAVSWTDSSGRLWVFGGQDGGDTFLNDLWYYTPSTNVWTPVIGGGSNANGTYGTKGTPGGAPGGRWGATGRIDTSGKVWLFGGYGFDKSSTAPGLLNDLWTYSGGQWTWVSGSNTENQNGVYGAEGTASASNQPGGRQAPVSWLDTSGNFWVFGGFNLSPTGQPNAFNDLWKYSGGQWTWVSGANSVNQLGTYGSQGVTASTNVPGARWAPTAWSDASGNFWLFGGFGYDNAGTGTLGDLWEFKGGQWIWVKGPSSVSQAGDYGVPPGVRAWPHVTNFPGTRWGAAYWVAPNGFWMWGGEGFDSTSGSGDHLLSDLWRYLPFP